MHVELQNRVLTILTVLEKRNKGHNPANIMEVLVMFWTVHVVK